MATQNIQPTQSGQPSLPDLTVLVVPAGQVLLFKARGRGVQIYPCDPATHAFGPATPQAILVTDDGDIIHHFKGPTWQAADGSLVVGTVVHKVPAPADDAIPWLLLAAAPGGTACVRFGNRRVFGFCSNHEVHRGFRYLSYFSIFVRLRAFRL